MNAHRRIRFALISLIAAAVFLAGASPATATDQPAPEDPHRPALQAATAGDLTWQFASRGVFADPRVVLAMAILLDEPAVMSAAGLPGQPFFYGVEETRLSLEEIPPDDAEPLLLASGILPQPGGSTQLEQSRRCRIWTPSTGDAQAEREAVVSALSKELVTVLGGIGLTIDPCEVAASPEEADLAVSVVDLDSGFPAFGDTSDETFLRLTIELPGLQPGAETGGGPAPDQGGNAGIATSEGNSIAVPLVVTALAALALFGGRWATRPDED
jgi:hypothetical protein